MVDEAYSDEDTGLGTSIEGRGKGGGGAGSSHGDSISSSIGEPTLAVAVSMGQGEGRNRSLAKLKGALCGNGDISIESGTKLGDEEGMGGVLTPSQRTGGVLVPSTVEVVSDSSFGTAPSRRGLYVPRLSNCCIRFEVNKDLRGVASWGLEQC